LSGFESEISGLSQNHNSLRYTTPSSLAAILSKNSLNTGGHFGSSQVINDFSILIVNGSQKCIWKLKSG
jgi:hypothetical protein